MRVRAFQVHELYGEKLRKPTQEAEIRANTSGAPHRQCGRVCASTYNAGIAVWHGQDRLRKTMHHQQREKKGHCDSAYLGRCTALNTILR